MKNKYFISIIFLLFIGFGCTNSKGELDGLWVSAYHIQTLPNEGISDNKKFMRILGDSIFFNTIGDPKNGIDAMSIKSKFKKKSDGIEVENESFDKIFIHEVSSDSVIISYTYQNSTREVFRKLNQPYSHIAWNPSNKSYEWSGNSSLVNTTFLDNGLFINYLPETNAVSVGHWNTIEEKNNQFVVFDGLNIDAISVDSLVKNRVYLSLHNEEKYNYTFKQQNMEAPKNLLGDWVLVHCDTLSRRKIPSPKGSKWSTMDFLSIREDSVLTMKNNVESTKKWTIGGANNLLIFLDEELKQDRLKRHTLINKERVLLRNIFKIDNLTENELVLLTEYQLIEFTGFEIKLIYKRKKTKDNNTDNN